MMERAPQPMASYTVPGCLSLKRNGKGFVDDPTRDQILPAISSHPDALRENTDRRVF